MTEAQVAAIAWSMTVDHWTALRMLTRVRRGDAFRRGAQLVAHLRARRSHLPDTVAVAAIVAAHDEWRRARVGGGS